MEEITPEWLTRVVQANGITATVTACDVKRIGSGQIGLNARIYLTYKEPSPPTDVPVTLVAKLPALDATGAETGFGAHLYKKEATFYRELAGKLRAKGMGIARPWAAECDEEKRRMIVLLDDMAPAAAGDQLAGCGFETAETAIRQLAIMHATFWDDSELKTATDWLGRPDIVEQAKQAKATYDKCCKGFIERYKDRISEEQESLFRRFGDVYDKWMLSRTGPWTLVHADFRLDNVLFYPRDHPGVPVTVDFQTLTLDYGGMDIGFFVAGCMSPEDRRAHGKQLLKIWYDEICRLGVKDYTFEQAWDAYRHGQFRGMVTAVTAAMFATRTARGDELFWRMAEVHVETALETGALELLPK